MTTKKDFISFAKMIKAQIDNASTPEARAAIEAIARAQAEQFAADNPRFDYGRFFAACGM